MTSKKETRHSVFASPGESAPSLTALGERIGEAAERVGGKRRLAQMAGVRESQLYRYIRGDNVPSALAAAALAEAAGVKLDWLIRGIGPLEERGAAAMLAEDHRPYSPMADWVVIPRIRATAAKPPLLAFHRDWLAEHHRKIEGLEQFQVEDDAMVPTFRPGDVVLIDTRSRRFPGAGLYLLELGGEPVIRRIATLPDGTLRLQCDNQAYLPVEVSEAEARALRVRGRVFWAGQECP